MIKQKYRDRELSIITGKAEQIMIINKILGAVLLGLCIWYILLLYKNNRNRL